MNSRIGAYVRQHHLAFLCLFLILGGGTAWALDRNSVKSKHIVNGQVKTPDLKGDAVKASKIADNAVRSPHVKNDGLTGADIDEGTLGLGTAPWTEMAFPNTTECTWRNQTPGNSSGAFVRDQSGFVHLKGVLRADKVFSELCTIGSFDDALIYTLPAGYRPAANGHFVAISNNELARVEVESDGDIWVRPPATAENIQQWLSLDGISFRCDPAGANGCP